MCNCVTQAKKSLSEKIHANIEKQHGEVEYVDSGTFGNAAIMLDGTGTRLYAPFEVVFRKKKKDGTFENRTSKFNSNVMASFCMFCGNKITNNEP